jgi:hypothetical protein
VQVPPFFISAPEVDSVDSELPLAVRALGCSAQPVASTIQTSETNDDAIFIVPPIYRVPLVPVT